MTKIRVYGKISAPSAEGLPGSQQVPLEEKEPSTYTPRDYQAQPLFFLDYLITPI